MLNMTPKWKLLPPDYCAPTVSSLAEWIMAGESGAVIGLPGMGKATLLHFLCHHPQALRPYLGEAADNVVLVPVDLNDLPNSRLSTLYRTILRAFYEIRTRFGPTLAPLISTLYQQYATTQDPFWVQSGIRELLLQLQREELRVVLVLNHFDRFCQIATRQMGYSLHGLRDSFKGTLCYLVGLQREIRYLPQADQLGPFYALLDTHVCWVRPLTGRDAHEMLARLTQTDTDTPLPEAEASRLLSLTGGCPALLRSTCHWWRSVPNKPPPTEWEQTLLSKANTQHRLGQMWAALTQEEQFVLSEVQRLQIVVAESPKMIKTLVDRLLEQNGELLLQLAHKGLCHEVDGVWQIMGELMAAFVATAIGQGRGRVWLDKAGNVYQGNRPIPGFQPLERSILEHLIQFPYTRHTYTELIEVAWSEDAIYREGKPTEAMYQIIRGVRKQIEPNPSSPVYILNWRGKPEGGYQLFPEGRPNTTSE